MDDLRALGFKSFVRHIALPACQAQDARGIKINRRVIFRSAPRMDADSRLRKIATQSCHFLALNIYYCLVNSFDLQLHIYNPVEKLIFPVNHLI